MRLRLALVLFLPCVLSGALAQSLPAGMVFLSEEYPPYSYVDENGRLRGQNAEKVLAAMDRLGLESGVKVLPWTRGYEMAKSGSGVFLFTCARIPEREGDFQWVVKLSSSDAWLVGLAANGYSPKSLAEAKRYRIGGVAGFRYIPVLREAGIVPGGKLVLSVNDEVNFRNLVSGRLDFAVMTSAQLEFFAKRSGRKPGEFSKALELPGLRTDDYLVTGKATPLPVVELVRSAFGSLP